MLAPRSFSFVPGDSSRKMAKAAASGYCPNAGAAPKS